MVVQAFVLTGVTLCGQWNGERATRTLGSSKATRNGQWLVLPERETMKWEWCSARGGVARLEGEGCDWLEVGAGGSTSMHCVLTSLAMEGSAVRL